MESQKLKTYKYPSYRTLRRKNKPLKRKFCKHMFVRSENIGKKRYKKDFLGRMYRNKEIHKWGLFDEFVADDSLVKPRYLIEMEVERNEEMINIVPNLIERKF